MIRFIKTIVLTGSVTLSVVHGQAVALSLVRNNSISNLNPTTPPMASLFDSQTGRLLGQQIPQDLAFAFYSEPLSVQADGPLVLYQLDDGNQTLFLSKTEDGRLIVSSLAGKCREIDPAGLAVLLNNVPILSIERSHAQALFGVSQYSGAVVCEDETGVLTVKTLPESSGVDQEVSLLYLRDAFEIPRAYITLSHGAIFDVFSLDGGLRFDQTDPKNPSYSALDPNGQPVVTSSTTVVDPTCEQIANSYHNCLTLNEQWREQSQLYADHLIHLTGIVKPFACKHALQIRGFPGCIVALAGFVTLVYPQPVADCTPQGSPAAACPPPPGSSPSCLAGVDCHLDGGNGSPYCVFATTGSHSCSSDRTCGGPAHCEAGICTTTPEPEVCNGRDDDCDSQVDEGVGGHLQLSGAGFLEVADASSLEFTGDFTIEFWANIASTSSYFPAVTKWNDAGVDRRGYFVTARDHPLYAGHARFSWSPTGVGFYDMIGPLVPFDEWHHYAAVRSGFQSLLYVDGILQSALSTASGPVLDTTEPLRVGAGLLYNQGMVYATGEMDEVRLWNLARTEAEIQASRFGSLAAPRLGLVGYWKFDGASIQEPDLSGHGNAGVFVGSASRSSCGPAQETMSVPTDGNLVTSTTVLDTGVIYQITASGTIFAGGTCSDTDADYYLCAQPQDTVQCDDGPWDPGLGINSQGNTRTKATHWGPYSQTHIYTIDFTGQGTPITLRYHDCYPGDNVGTFAVEIIRTAQ